MARLGADEDDIEWLVDDGDLQAFSHSLYEDINGTS
jgi:succinate--hydroxymethylglutarate CoA-transferase